MACELIETCIFFNEKMEATPEMLALYRARYCRGTYAECARYTVYAACGRDAVPSDMYPNDRLRAMKMVRPPGNTAG